MLRLNPDIEEDIFFDASDSSKRSSIDSSPLLEELFKTINLNFESTNFISEFSTMELSSIHERRNKFFKGVGLDEFLQFQFQKDEILDFEGISETRDTVSDSPSCSKSNNEINLDTGGVLSVIKDSITEIGSEKLKSFQDFEALLGITGLVRRFLKKDLFERNKKIQGPLRKFKKLWRVFSKRRKPRTFDLPEYNNNYPPNYRTPIRVEVNKHNKKYMEFSSVYMDQEIKAHKGPIGVMKFSPNGLYLATAGEDSVLKIWKIREMESPIGSARIKTEGILGIIEVENENVNGSGLAIIPNKVFNILDTPLHEFRGHDGEILDLTWSKSNDYLLTSSMDKTVRLWKIGSENCIAAFRHSTYVTSVQFNPIDEGIFMSGSVDGKVRFWRISENRVFDWVESRHIITSVSFQPDAKGFAVGCFNGTCRLYELRDENIVLVRDLQFESKRKSSAKRITSLQYTESGYLVITSGSRVHITDGINILQKSKGLRRSKSLASPSFTSDGRHIISVCDQSRVQIFNSNNFTNSPSDKKPVPNRSSETFSSSNASIAVSWPGFEKLKLDQQSDPLVDCLSLGSCLFLMGPAATWPEERLGLKNVKDLISVEKLGKFVNCENYGAWNEVVVTGGSDGVIRSFHNYGFPVRL